MLLDEKVDILLNSYNIKYWEYMGYEIPRYKPYHNRNVLRFKAGTKIEVKVKDLPKRSNVIVRRKCDICGNNTNKEHLEIFLKE